FQVERKGTYRDVEVIDEDEEADTREVRFQIDELTERLNVRTHVIVTGIPGFDYDNTYDAQLEWNVDRLEEINVPEPEPEPEEPIDPEEPEVYEEGEYSIPFRALHATEEKESSMRDWLVNPAMLSVKDGKMVVSFTVQEKPGQ